MPAFKTLQARRASSSAPATASTSARSTIEVGGTTETIDVKGESPIIQAKSGERSFTISTESVDNLPIANRSFTALALLAPGVTTDGNATPQRIGGGGDTNIMMDGVSTMDTGSNRPLLQMNVESIAEVKVLTSGYQAEYGRASGVQITAVTKSGTNRFRGSVYDVERNSDWNANSKTEQAQRRSEDHLEGDATGATRSAARSASPAATTSCSSSTPGVRAAHARQRRRSSYRMPTALERQGDFSQTHDNNGDALPVHQGPAARGRLHATDQTACFADGGVLGQDSGEHALSDRA